MTKKVVVTIIVAVVAALLIGTGIGILAAGSAGSADDPLITLSYLNEKFKTDLMTEIDSQIKARGDEITAKIDASLTGGDGAAAPSDAFKVVTLSTGQTLTLTEGAELLVREGAAVIAGGSLANTTTGVSETIGAPALINNMYLATSAGSGVTAGAAPVKLLVRGEYTISG